MDIYILGESWNQSLPQNQRDDGISCSQKVCFIYEYSYRLTCKCIRDSLKFENNFTFHQIALFLVLKFSKLCHTSRNFNISVLFSVMLILLPFSLTVSFLSTLLFSLSLSLYIYIYIYSLYIYNCVLFVNCIALSLSLLVDLGSMRAKTRFVLLTEIIP